jgi:hypothetical protein
LGDGLLLDDFDGEVERGVAGNWRGGWSDVVADAAPGPPKAKIGPVTGSNPGTSIRRGSFCPVQ